MASYRERYLFDNLKGKVVTDIVHNEARDRLGFEVYHPTAPHRQETYFYNVVDGKFVLMELFYLLEKPVGVWFVKLDERVSSPKFTHYNVVFDSVVIFKMITESPLLYEVCIDYEKSDFPFEIYKSAFSGKIKYSK